MARLDKYLAKLNGEEVTPPAPVTRLDKSLAHAIDGDVSLPAPIASIDRHMDEISGGGGNTDLTIANVTVAIGTLPTQYVTLGACVAYDEDEMAPSFPAMSLPMFGVQFEADHSYTLKVILYKGQSYARVNGVTSFANDVQVSGNATKNNDMEAIFITGDATITIDKA